MRQSLGYVFLLSISLVSPAALVACGDDGGGTDFPRFDAGPPETPRCDDGRRNGTETHRDCGGDCAPLGGLCGDGQGCKQGSDCASGSCTCDQAAASCVGPVTGFCLLPTCDDGVLNQAETDVDCGGGCGPCEGGQGCSADADCASRVCVAGACLPTSCGDGMTNAGESDLDCGGPCPGCAAGLACEDANDCESLNCVENVCLPAACDDGVRNQDETDVDCGGAVCAERCQDQRACTAAGDCLNGVCAFGTCISCEDGFQNGMETDRDCGGPDCGACPGGFGCRENGDCATARCEDFLCISCMDFVQNGAETDIDCGGTDCGPCLDRRMCLAPTDCASARCDEMVCISCGDGARNGAETDVDCGGDECDACADRLQCDVNADCRSGRCIDGVCVSCSDRVSNGDETGTDCGGTVCSACPGGEGCLVAADCLSLVCEDNSLPTPPKVCAAPDCTDGVKNGVETDVDCGGGFCPACGTGDACAAADDCTSRVCRSGVCQAPTCSDGVRNGNETDVDCGGPTGAGACGRCADGRICAGPGDCTSAACTYLLCGTDPCEELSSGPTSDYDVCDFVTTAADVIEDISDTGTEASLTDDGNVRVSLPFEFDFWGNPYSEVWINANGGLSFGFIDASIGPLGNTNVDLPYDAVPSRLILPYWDDLDPSRAPSAVFYDTIGTEGSRQFIVQWRVQHADTAAPLSTDSAIDVRVALFEGSNEIWMFYADTTFGTSTLDRGLSATSGINEWLGRKAFQYSSGDDVLVPGLVVQYSER